jgi:hypothetical protein
MNNNHHRPFQNESVAVNSISKKAPSVYTRFLAEFEVVVHERGSAEVGALAVAVSHFPVLQRGLPFINYQLIAKNIRVIILYKEGREKRRAKSYI